MRPYRPFSIALLLLCFTPVLCGAFQARVVKVVDGDTVLIEYQGGTRPIHLVEIDCPQLSQPYGKAARDLTRLCLEGKMAEIHSRNGLHASDIRTPEGRSISFLLMRKGLAWYPKNYNRQDPLNMSRFDGLGKLEKTARKRRIGLWSQADPQPPWTLHKWQESVPDLNYAPSTVITGGAKTPTRRRG